jgi:hypothetical protein
MMSISLKKTNKKLDTLIDLMANDVLVYPTKNPPTDNEGECSVCGTTAPRIYLNV